MHTGEIQAHLPSLLEQVPAPTWLPGLIEAKAAAEHGAMEGPDTETVAREVAALHEVLDKARRTTRLPEPPTCFEALDELVVRVRLGE